MRRRTTSLASVLAVASASALLFAAPAAAVPPGPIPVLHVSAWYCRAWQTSNCGTFGADYRIQHDLYYTFYGNVSGGVTCTSTPYGQAPNQHIYVYITSQVTWTVSCTDSQGEGFSKTVTLQPAASPMPPGPVPWLHIGSWSCYPWYTSNCGTVGASAGTDMYYTFYGNVSGGVTCTSTPYNRLPNVHFPYPGTAATWHVDCSDANGEGFEKTVTIQPT